MIVQLIELAILLYVFELHLPRGGKLCGAGTKPLDLYLYFA
jgi:hypothetical protein